MPGAFYLAIKAGVDVVPVALVGTFDLLPMNAVSTCSLTPPAHTFILDFCSLENLRL
jgi:1-acyl-sn-glycerol-3-phosphate acyltransferase